MKVVAITDKLGSAIDRLARMNEKRLTHLRYTVLPLHPKRPSEAELQAVKDALEDTDVIDAQYWKSAVLLRQRFPELSHKPTILTHHNEHNIHDTMKDRWAWKGMDWHIHVAKNEWQKRELKKEGIDARLIRHAIEWGNFSYAEKLTDEKIVGYVGQIKKVKGVKFIAQACKDLGYKLLLAGSVSESEYAAELMRDYEDTIITRIPGTFACPDSLIGEVYHKMAVYCANSDDGTESGTMPILEAMASGIPVVARNFGLVRDAGQHQKNMIVRTGKYDDVDDLKQWLKLVVENRDIADKLRDAAWRTSRQYHPDIHAREYEKLFRKALYPKTLTVSVIMPTYNRNQILQENILHLDTQTYKNFEVVVCDDNEQEESTKLALWIDENRHRFHFPIKRIWTRKSSIIPNYGLAKARNVGLIEATGEIAVFLDDRLRMHPQAIENFVNMLMKGKPNEKVWLWGSKGVFKTFVENFSAAWRRCIIDAGMFNERIDKYGGMTQEVSGRFGAQGFRFEFCAQALAEPMIGTHSKSKHREEIVESKIKLYKMGFQ